MIPTVSVIVPNYNHAKYLKNRIDSILSQTYQDFEVIILDDFSTDNSSEIIEKYRNHPKIRIIEYNSSNSGSPFKQWNKGIMMARSDYIWIAESDDIADPCLLETLIGYLKKDETLGLAYAQSKYVDESQKHIGFSKGWTDIISTTKWNKSYRNNGLNEIATGLCLRNTIPNASAAVFKKKIYLQSGGAEESMRVCGDWIAWLNILSISDVQFHAEILNFHRCHQVTSRQMTSQKQTTEENIMAWEHANKLLTDEKKYLFKNKEILMLNVRFWSSCVYRRWSICEFLKNTFPNCKSFSFFMHLFYVYIYGRLSFIKHTFLKPYFSP
jgi:glycosyltransferase involved in cell wall biosynthesis